MVACAAGAQNLRCLISSPPMHVACVARIQNLLLAEHLGTRLFASACRKLPCSRKHGEVNSRLPLRSQAAPVLHTATEARDRRYVSGTWDRQIAAIAQEGVSLFLNTDWEVGVVAAGVGDRR